MGTPVTFELVGHGVLRHEVAGLAARLHRLRQVGPHYTTRGSDPDPGGWVGFCFLKYGRIRIRGLKRRSDPVCEIRSDQGLKSI